MNATQTLINCETTEEHSHAVPSNTTTTIITSSQPVDNVSTMVQGVSGAVYAPMDTTPQTPEQQANARVARLLDTLTGTLTLLVKELQAPTQPQTDLEEAVSTALEQAQWFKDRIEENCADAIENHDFDYEIGNNVERYMRNSFDPNDHVDFNELVADRVDDVIDDIVADKVYDYLDNNLDSLLKERLQNANITINF